MDNRFVLPYRKIKSYYLVECYMNNSMKGYCIVDLNKKHSYLNDMYYPFISKTNNLIVIKRFTCFFLKVTNRPFQIINTEHYEKKCGISIYGILGADFFNHHTLEYDDKKNSKLIFN